MSFSGGYWMSTGTYWDIQGTPAGIFWALLELLWGLPGSTGCLLGSTGVIPGPVGACFYWALLGFTGTYWYIGVLLGPDGSNGLCWVLLDPTQVVP